MFLVRQTLSRSLLMQKSSNKDVLLKMLGVDFGMPRLCELYKISLAPLIEWTERIWSLMALNLNRFCSKWIEQNSRIAHGDVSITPISSHQIIVRGVDGWYRQKNSKYCSILRPVVVEQFMGDLSPVSYDFPLNNHFLWFKHHQSSFHRISVVSQSL